MTDARGFADTIHSLLKEVRDHLEAGLETEHPLEEEGSKYERALVARIDKVMPPPKPPFVDPLEALRSVDDVVLEGPRISLRYGSAATEISIGLMAWRRTDPPLGHWQNRWRRIDDYTEIDNCVGKRAMVTRGSGRIVGVVTEDDSEGGEVSLDGRGFFRITDLTILPDIEHLNMFEKTIYDHIQTMRAKAQRDG